MKTKNAPAISISKKVYTMATTDESGSSAEITMYGDIYEQQPTNWWGEPIEGQYILLSEFLEDLKQISSCKNITIRMNSYGGDAGASKRRKAHLHCGWRRHVGRQHHHVRLRYGQGQSVQHHYDSQVLAVSFRRL